MNTLNTQFEALTRSQHEVDKQINRLIAEATILLYEIETLAKKGVTSK